MKIKLILISFILTATQICWAIEAIHAPTSTASKIETPAKAEVNQDKTTATAAKPEKKKKKSFFAIFDIVGKVKEFVAGKSKQNTNAIDETVNGTYQARPKRALSSDPKTRAIQEKLDKLQAERLKKYENE